MQCPIRSGRWDELYVAYVARTLPLQERATLDLHLVECEECRTLAAAQSSVWAAMDAWQPLDVSPSFDKALYERLAAEAKEPWYAKLAQGKLAQGKLVQGKLVQNWSFRPAVSIAGACAVIMAALLFYTPFAEVNRENDVRHVLVDQAHVDQVHVDIEQVERALDDIDMLKQVGVVPPQADQAARSESL